MHVGLSHGGKTINAGVLPSKGNELWGHHLARMQSGQSPHEGQASGWRTGSLSGKEKTESKGTFEVRAKRVVLCAGALQTPAMLQRSGIQPPSGQLGRNLAVHPGSAVVAMFDEPVYGWRGAHQSLQVREFEDEGIVLAAVNLPPALVARALPFDGDELAKVMTGYNHMVTAGRWSKTPARGE